MKGKRTRKAPQKIKRGATKHSSIFAKIIEDRAYDALMNSGPVYFSQL